jgi:inner membrane protein
MPIPQHLLSGWCLAHLAPLSARERGLAILAASLADLDGLGIVYSAALYGQWHHKVGHNVFYGLLLAVALACVSGRASGRTESEQKQRWLRLAGFYFFLFHIHLVLDFYGSGPGWGVYYLWPVDPVYLLSDHAWPFMGWQNMTALAVLIVWTLGIFWIKARTPFELITPGLEADLRRWVQRRRSV